MKKALLFLAISLMSFNSLAQSQASNISRSPAVIESETEIIDSEALSLEGDQVKPLPAPKNVKVSVREETKKNKVAVHVGTGKTGSSLYINPNDFEFYSEEEEGTVFGVEYLRRNVFSVFGKDMGLSAQFLSNKTYLLGVSTQIWKIEASLLGGLGVQKFESESATDNISDPQATEINKSGFVGGLQLSVPVYKDLSIQGQFITNGTMTGGIGFSF